MKKILFAMLFICFQYNIYAQCTNAVPCFDFYIKTPNNSNVKACSVSYPSWFIQQADEESRAYAITVYESGTSTYNCHAYAWHVKEGKNKVWVNNICYEAGNLNAYWNDYSYTFYDKTTKPHLDNLKVFYVPDDYSAITTSNSNIFISKMGAGCLVSHTWNNSPYDHCMKNLYQ